MNTYTIEQMITDKYGDKIIGAIARSYFDKYATERVTDRETQIAGIDYFFWRTDARENNTRAVKYKIDLKLDFYENNNFALELYQQYSGIGEQSWVHHDPDIIIGYYKVYLRKCFLIKLADLQEFMKTDTFKKRRTFYTNRQINGKAGGFKNFSMDELPVMKVIDIQLTNGPFDIDSLLETRPSLPASVLYKNS